LVEGAIWPKGYVPRQTFVDSVLVSACPAEFEKSCSLFQWSSPNYTMEEREVQKYSDHEPFLADPFLFEEAIDLVLEHIEPYVSGAWTDLDDLQLELTGSPGRPYKSFAHTRLQYLTSHRSEVESWMAGVDASDVWDCFGKLEVLPKEKARAKCRLICGSGMRTAFCGAALHEKFNRSMSDAWRSIHSKIGFSKFHRGWDELYQLISDAGTFDEADCKQWDSGMHGVLLYAVYDLRARLGVYSSQQWKLFDSFLNNLVFSTLVLSSGKSYTCNSGNKSGSPCTAHDNTLGNLICLAYAWLAVGRNPSDFHLAPILVYGDDLLTGSFGAGFWDEYRKCGVKLPSDRVKISLPISECSFLSQRFVDYHGTYVPEPNGWKYVYAACLSDCKIEPQLQYERVWSLWIDGFFSPVEPVLRRLATICADRANQRRPSAYEAIRLWLSLEVDGAINICHDEEKVRKIANESS